MVFVCYRGGNMKYMLLLILFSLMLFGCTTTVIEETYTPEPAKNTTVDVVVPPPQVVEPEVVTGYSGKWLAGKTTYYIEYTDYAYATAIRENKLILLNFYNYKNAACVKDDAEALKAFTSMNYDDVIGFRVDFGNENVDVEEKNIALKHGIAVDNTKVIVRDGKRVFKEVVSWSKDDYVTEIGRNRG
jgi:hypothetical protein